MSKSPSRRRSPEILLLCVVLGVVAWMAANKKQASPYDTFGVKLGMSESQVRHLLGEPRMVDTVYMPGEGPREWPHWERFLSFEVRYGDDDECPITVGFERGSQEVVFISTEVLERKDSEIRLGPKASIEEIRAAFGDASFTNGSAFWEYSDGVTVSGQGTSRWNPRTYFVVDKESVKRAQRS